MGTGYTRKDTANNIDDGNVINAADLDLEFDGIQSAFDNSTGHTHDGTAGEGAPIETIGPAQDVVATASALRPKTDNTVDLGTTALEYKDLFLDGTAHIDTLDVDENASITGTLSVTSTSTFSDDVTLTGANYNVVWDKSADALEFADNAKAVFGAGDDLQIYHDGDHSRIVENGTGNLFIQGQSAIILANSDASEFYATFNDDGASTLRYNNSTKLATTSTGISVTGDVDASDDLILSSDASKVTFGADGDVEIIHSHNAGLTIDRTTTGTGSLVLALRSNQDTIVAGDQISRINFSTNSSAGGAAVGTQASIKVEATGTYSSTVAGSMMEFYTTTSNGTNSLAMAIDDDQSIRFTGGTDVKLDATNDTLDIPDNFKIMVGSGDDLEIYHNGSNSFITHTGTGHLYLRNGVADKDVKIQSDDGSGGLADYFVADGSVGQAKMYHYGNLRINTTSDGNYFTGSSHQFVGTNAGTKIQIQSTDSGGSDGPVLELYRNSSSPAADDDIGRIDFLGEDSAGVSEVYGRIEMYIEDPTASASTARMELKIQNGADALPQFLTLRSDTSVPRVVVNEGQADIDFIVEGDTRSNLLYADASTDRIGIGTGSPATTFHVNSGAANTVARFESTDTESVIELVDTTGRAQIRSRNDFRFYVAGDTVRAMDITSAGLVGIGTASPDTNLHISDTSGAILTLQRNDTDVASGNRIGEISFITNDSSEDGDEVQAYIKAICADGTPDSHLTFGTLRNIGDQDDTVAERMRITSDGKVGIGTTNPQYGRLHISDGNSDIDMDTNGSGQLHIDGNAFGFGIALNTDGAQLYTNSASRDIILGTNETERLRVDNNATTTLTGTAPRIVFDNSDTTLSQGQLIGEIDFKNNDASGFGPNVAANIRAETTGSGGQNAALLFRTTTGAAEGADATTTMYLNSSGHVGINTESPEATLHVNDVGSTGPAVFVENAGATEGDFAIAHDEAMQMGHWNKSTDTFTLRIRYNSTGDVTLGTTTQSAATLVGSGSDGNGVARAYNGYFVAARDDNACIYANRLSSDGITIAARKDGTQMLNLGVRTGTATGEFWIGNQTNIGLRSEQSGADRLEPCKGASGDARDNAIDLGSTSVRFDDIYATNNAIQTSDEREKQQINTLTTAEIAAAKAISKLFKTYKWNDSVEAKGDAARTHAGVVAQQIEAAMTAEGLSAGDYAFFVETTWWETETEVDATEADEENPAMDAYTRIDTYATAEAAPEGATERNRKGIRYGELMSFIHAATEQRLASIESRLDALESA